MSVERAISLLHIGTLSTDRHQSLCLIRTLASDHAVVRASLPVMPGAGLSLGLRNGLSIAVSVEGAQDERIKLKFGQPIPMDRLERDQARGSGGAESVRVPASGEVKVEMNGTRIVAILRDISLFGVGLADMPENLPAGAEVTVHIAGLVRRTAIVRWQKNGQAGLRFAHSLGYELLDSWLIRRGD